MANHYFDYQGTKVYFQAGGTTTASNANAASIFPTAIDTASLAPVHPVRKLSSEHWETRKINNKRRWVLQFGGKSPLTSTLKTNLETFWRDTLDGSRRRFDWYDVNGKRRVVRWLGQFAFADFTGEQTQYGGSIMLAEDALTSVEPTWGVPNISTTNEAYARNNGFRVIAYTGTGATQTISCTIRPSVSFFKKRSSAAAWLVGSPSFYTDGDNFEISTTSFISATEETTTFSDWTATSVDVETATTVNENTSTYVSIHFNATVTAYIHFARLATNFKSVNQATYSQGTYAGDYDHDMGAVPGMILARRITGDGGSWFVYHKSLGDGKILRLESSTAASSVNFWTDPPTGATLWWDYRGQYVGQDDGMRLWNKTTDDTHTGGGNDPSFYFYNWDPLFYNDGDAHGDDPKTWNVELTCRSNGHVGSFNTDVYTPAKFNFKKWYAGDSKPGTFNWATDQSWIVGGPPTYTGVLPLWGENGPDIDIRIAATFTELTATDTWDWTYKSKAWCVLALGNDPNQVGFGKYTGSGASTSIATDSLFVPGAILIKRTDAAGPWVFADRERGATKFVYFNDDDAEVDGSSNPNIRVASFENSKVLIGTHADVNDDGGTYVYTVWKY